MFIALLFLFLSGCIVFSFYPLYTEKDLFPNDLLLGEWVDSDSAVWKFEYDKNSDKNGGLVDSTAYILKIKDKGDLEFERMSFNVHLVQLEGTYFLDFYLHDYFNKDDLNFFDLHLLPVHSFAKLQLNSDVASLHWFSPDWLEKLIHKKKIRLPHENNGEHLLLTAKTKDLQKFVIKYMNSEEAFAEGIETTMRRVQ